jgi:general secretion pathway protein C
MKRLPVVVTLLALVLLAVSATFWGLRLYKPAQRPLLAVAPPALAEPAPDAAATLFGGQAMANVATSYQLTGIVAAGRDSVAIIVADGQPPKAVKVGYELAPGVRISEVRARYIMLSEGGVMKRVDLAADAKPAISLSGAVLAPTDGGVPRPTIAPAGALLPGEPQLGPGAVQVPPPGEVNPVQQPGQEAQQDNIPPDAAPPNAPQMPPPTRVMGSPVSGAPPGGR